MLIGSEIDALLKTMQEARQKWLLAFEKSKDAGKLFRDTEGNSDGVKALRRATEEESEALRRYSKALRAYVDAAGLSPRRPKRD